VRAEFPNSQELLRPGMFGRIKVDLGARPDSILVPERAVAELQGKNFVWVIGADDTATQRAVQVGEAIGGNVLITEGLKPGERIVVEGLQKVREGQPVQFAPAEETASVASSQGAGPKGAKGSAPKHGKE
jgi:membrane fusion protein (multidrug efflux system)